MPPLEIDVWPGLGTSHDVKIFSRVRYSGRAALSNSQTRCAGIPRRYHDELRKDNPPRSTGFYALTLEGIHNMELTKEGPKVHLFVKASNSLCPHWLFPEKS